MSRLPGLPPSTKAGHRTQETHDLSQDAYDDLYGRVKAWGQRWGVPMPAAVLALDNLAQIMEQQLAALGVTIEGSVTTTAPTKENDA